MKRLITGIILALFYAGITHAETIYVNQTTGSDTNSGTSWQQSYQTLQKALESSSIGDEIWVAKGTYYPTTDNDRSVSFYINQPLKIYGGFAGTESTLDERVLGDNHTVLSGDIGEVDVNTDNSYQVVKIENVLEDEVLFNGFVIEKGFGGSLYYNGSGIYIHNSDFVLEQSIIRNNDGYYGGGIYTNNSSSDKGSLIVTNSLLYKNISTYEGAAIYNGSNADMDIYNTTIAENRSHNLYDHAVYSSYYSAKAYNTIIWGNVDSNGNQRNAQGVYFYRSINGDGKNFYDNSINVDPLFIDAENNDFSLFSGSPALNYGNADYVSSISDINGANRTYSSAVDLGAIEAQKLEQNLVFEAIDAKAIDDGSFTLEVSSNIETTFTYLSSDETIATVDENGSVTLLSQGTTEITVIAEGNNNFLAARKTQLLAIGERIYVSKEGDNTSGGSWATAFHNLDDALEVATENDNIWIAEGTYTPTKRLESNNPRTATFELKNKVSIYGGFQWGETSFANRNIEQYPTILSGDIGETENIADNAYHVVYFQNISAESKEQTSAKIDGVTITNGNANFSENQHDIGGGLFVHYVTLNLNNVTVSDNYSTNSGAGIFMSSSNLDIINSTIEDNKGTGVTVDAINNSYATMNIIVDNSIVTNNKGHGLYIFKTYGEVKIKDSDFSFNSIGYYNTSWSSDLISDISNSNFHNNKKNGIYVNDHILKLKDSEIYQNKESGIYFYQWNTRESTILTHNLIYENEGFGMFVHSGGESDPKIIIKHNHIFQNFGIGARLSNVIFQHNLVEENKDTGVFTEDSRIEYNIIRKNKCYGGGGGIILAGSPTLKNNLIVENEATYGGGLLISENAAANILQNTIANNIASENGSGIYNNSNASIITNTLLWNGDNEVYNSAEENQVLISFSLVNGGYTGEGNINNDPLFVNSSIGNYRLQSNSPALNAGTNTILLDDELDLDSLARRYEGGQVDIGAYEAQGISREGSITIKEIGNHNINDGDFTLTVTTDLTETLKYTSSNTDIAEIDEQGKVSINSLGSVYLSAFIEGNDEYLPVSSTIKVTIATDILYVGADGDNSDGLTWQTAFHSPQDAFNNAEYANQIWIQNGVYTPVRSVSEYNTDERSKVFLLNEGIEVYGGFIGDETTLEERDLNTALTILSGEIQNDDDISNNAYTIMRLSTESEKVRLDGLKIEKGYGFNDDYINYNTAAGLDIYTTDVTIINSSFSDNATHEGGAVKGYNANIYIYNSLFTSNQASRGAVVYNMGDDTDKVLHIESSNFINNLAFYYGESIVYTMGSVNIYNSIFYCDNPTNGNYIYANSTLEAFNNMFDQNNYYGDENIYGQNPQFKDLENGDYSLLSSSPALNAGTNTYVSQEKDYLGNNRIFDETIDIGAIEVQKLRQVITFNPIENTSIFEESITLDISSNSENTFLYELSNPLIANIDNGELSMLNRGYLTVTVKQEETEEYLESEASQSFRILSPIYVANPELAIEEDINENADTLWVPGNHNSWLFDDSGQLYRVAENVYSGYLYLEGYFKITDAPNWDNSLYGSNEEYLLEQSITSGNIPVPYDGYTYLTVDLNTMTYSFMEYIPEVNPEEILIGGSWDKPFHTIQEAIDEVTAEEEIWVASGVYSPSGNDRYNSIFLNKDNVKIYGGFNGTESSLSDRDPVNNKVIFSGNIGEENVETDNSFTVVRVNGYNNLLDGITIQDGYADGFNDTKMGGGIKVLEYSSLTIRDCIIQNNYADLFGGGLKIDGNEYYSYPYINIERSIFRNNAAAEGAGIHSRYGQLYVSNSLIYKNRATDFGGGVYVVNNQLTHFEHVTIADNKAKDTSSAFGGKYVDYTFINSIVWNNEINTTYSKATIENSIIAGEDESDPLFKDDENNDYSLTSNSPALNQVVSFFDEDYFGNARLFGDLSDMGAIEMQKLPQTILLKAEEQRNIEEQGYYLDLTTSVDNPLQYSTSDNEVATVTEEGQVLLHKTGEVVIIVEQEETETYLASRAEQHLSIFYGNITDNEKQAQEVYFEAFDVVDIAVDTLHLNATASSGLEVNYASSNPAIATIDQDGVLHIHSAGVTYVSAFQSGNDEYNPAEIVTRTLIVTEEKEYQQITFEELPEYRLMDESFNLQATSSSGLEISYLSSNKAVATINDDNSVQLLTAGVTYITAYQLGNDSYYPAEVVTHILVVKEDNEEGKLSQVITFEPIGIKELSQESFTINATASSGLVISYSVSNPSIASVDENGEVSLLSEGVTYISAYQSGNEEYLAADIVIRELIVINDSSDSKLPQVITFDEIPQKSVEDPSFLLQATSTSGLKVSYSVHNPTVASVDDEGNIHIVGGGVTYITAYQEGSDVYHAADMVTRVLTVTKLPQEIIANNSMPQTMTEGETFQISAEATSGLRLNFSSTDETIATVSETGKVTFVGASDDEVELLLTQEGNDIYEPADVISYKVKVNSSVTAIGDELENFKAYINNNELIIEGIQVDELQLMNIMGQKLSYTYLENKALLSKVSLPSNAPSILVIRISSRGEILTKKIMK